MAIHNAVSHSLEHNIDPCPPFTPYYAYLVVQVILTLILFSIFFLSFTLIQMQQSLLVLFALVLLAGEASAAPVYVQGGSTCTTACGSSGSPYPTITQGLSASGDVILLPGTLTGPGNFNLQISSSAPVTIQLQLPTKSSDTLLTSILSLTSSSGLRQVTPTMSQ